jgi:hypothetical protein
MKLHLPILVALWLLTCAGWMVELAVRPHTLAGLALEGDIRYIAAGPWVDSPEGTVRDAHLIDSMFDVTFRQRRQQDGSAWPMSETLRISRRNDAVALWIVASLFPVTVLHFAFVVGIWAATPKVSDTRTPGSDRLGLSRSVH